MDSKHRLDEVIDLTSTPSQTTVESWSYELEQVLSFS